MPSPRNGKCNTCDNVTCAKASDPEERIMLCSLKAGGTGINLVSANHLVLMDPWWNPAAEEQAIDRVYRIGQTRDVQVCRLVIKGSIEERMLQLADQKRALYEGVTDKKTPAELRNMRWQIMSSLFE
jgi:SNF2 family DNA or RNA helicase